MLKAWLIAPIRAYQFFLSPWLGQSCRFTPTCSNYAIEAITKLGSAQGVYVAVKRLGRCHPWCQGGLDPVPEQTAKIVPKKPDGEASSHRCHLD